ncbi:hypothetical protein K488DRAFT_67421 [Vararia minispora EC-137]|uniref:Uncharacterized protein n=1 Tax=Vararia minispora EC-137 TaxID=1314806 RepID=A0ACB8QYL8_9AGAM|nr:hypothetical protein K488DRAFT_67421 [Vararia minispora EC-137]
MDSLSLTDSFTDFKPDLSLDSSITLQDPQGLPTPPFSPTQSHTAYPLQPQNDVIALANELIAHYQKESIWVHHTRASLELALTADGCDSFTAVRAKRAFSQSPSVKNESEATKPQLQKRSSRWMQRKKSFNLNLKLDGEPHPAAAALARRRRRNSQVNGPGPTPESSTKLLEMFSELMEARMESCVRISALAQAVYAPSLGSLPP